MGPIYGQVFPRNLPLIVNMQEFPSRILLGDPDTPAKSGVEGPKGVAEGDLRGDGSPDDLAVSNLDGTVTVLFGSRGGDWKIEHLRTEAQTLRGVIIADINGDKKNDVVTAAPFEGTVFAFLNRGNDTFSPAEPIPAAQGQGVRNLAAADFDGDGHIDLAVAGSCDRPSPFEGLG